MHEKEDDAQPVMQMPVGVENEKQGMSDEM